MSVEAVVVLAMAMTSHGIVMNGGFKAGVVQVKRVGCRRTLAVYHQQPVLSRLTHGNRQPATGDEGACIVASNIRATSADCGWKGVQLLYLIPTRSPGYLPQRGLPHRPPPPFHPPHRPRAHCHRRSQ